MSESKHSRAGAVVRKSSSSTNLHRGNSSGSVGMVKTMGSNSSLSSTPRSPRSSLGGHSRGTSFEMDSSQVNGNGSGNGNAGGAGNSGGMGNEALGARPPQQEKQTKLWTVGAQIALFITGWYICSGVTLFGNKHMLSTLHANPDLLAVAQMTITFTMGATKMYGAYVTSGFNAAKLPVTPYHTLPRKEFLMDMAFVGIMRVATVLLGLVSLKFVAVSFTETVKSSAPFFTVVFARLMLGERTSFLVNMSLVPVVLGLALCSATELSFTTIGFGAAVLTNCMDCVQNVFSKKLLSVKGYNYVNLQFYTSAAALTVQLPVMIFLNWGDDFFGNISSELAFALLINGAFFHMQSVMAYAVMGLVSPVTQSVVNTLKRALLIWLSVLIFHNKVAPLSAVGTAICVMGVLAYNFAIRRYPAGGRPRRAPNRNPSDVEKGEAEEMRPLRGGRDAGPC